MFSCPIRFGPVVWVTVRYHSCSSVTLPFQPYQAAGSTSPPASTRANGTRERHPNRHASQGTRTSAYGFTKTPAATSAPAVYSRPCCAAMTAPSRSSATGRLNCPNPSSFTRNLPFKSSVSQNSVLADSPSIGQRGERQVQEPPGHRHRQREPGELRDLLGHPGEGHHREREGGEILVLVVLILGPVQRFGSEEAPCRRAGHGEVDEFVAVQPKEAVESEDDQGEEEGPNEHSRSRRHVPRVPFEASARLPINATPSRVFQAIRLIPIGIRRHRSRAASRQSGYLNVKPCSSTTHQDLVEATTVAIGRGKADFERRRERRGAFRGVRRSADR